MRGGLGCLLATKFRIVYDVTRYVFMFMHIHFYDIFFPLLGGLCICYLGDLGFGAYENYVCFHYYLLRINVLHKRAVSPSERYLFAKTPLNFKYIAMS
jgi:hypothetical protein